MNSTSETTPLVSADGTKSDNEADPEGQQSGACVEHRGAYKDVEPSWSEVMQKLTPYLKPIDRWHMTCTIGAVISVLVGKVLGVLPPLAIKYAVDAISEDSSTIWPVMYAIGAYGGLRLLVMLNTAVQDLAQRSVALDAERRFAVATFAHLHHLSLSYHLEKHIGEITRIMNRGSDSISSVISSFLFYLAPTFFEAIVVSAVFWQLGTPTVALSTIVAVVVFLTFTILMTKTRIAFRRKLIEASDLVGQKETETLVNYETVSMFGRTQFEIQDYGAMRLDYKNRRVEMLGLFTLLELGQKAIRLGGMCAGLVIAGRATVYGYGPNNEQFLSPGSFVVIQMYIEQLFQPLSQLGWQYRMITQAFTDLEKTVTMLNRRPEVEDLPHAIEWRPSPGVGTKTGEIMFSGVTFHYKVRSRKRDLGSALLTSYKGLGEGVARHGPRRGRAGMGYLDEGTQKVKKNKSSENGEEEDTTVELGGVTDIDFTVPAGKTAALVGASGSGKTTIVRLVLRMYDTDEGSVFIDGKNVRDFTQISLRHNIGVVAQDTILFNATLRENITYGKEDATEEEIWAAVRTAALESFVSDLPDKLDTLVGERGMKLSGGERQRVGLARCIIKDPQLVLLDEATSALDSATEREIQKNISEVCRGRTTLMIAHRLSTARRADSIIVLDKGRMVERGTHDELLAMKGYYAKMWTLQTESEDS